MPSNGQPPSVSFRGEHMTKRELTKRFMLMFPNMAVPELLARIKQETGVVVLKMEAYKVRKNLGLKKVPMRPPKRPKTKHPPQPTAARTTTPAPAAPGKFTLEVDTFIGGMQYLSKAVEIFGSKSVVQRVLDAM